MVMAGNPLHKPVIPRRSRVCSKSQKKFEPGDEYLSIISEGEHEGLFHRDDILLEYWEQNRDEALLKNSCSSWRAKIPAGAEAPKEAEELLERAFELFFEALDKPDPVRAFILALFLARKKVLIFRQEMFHQDKQTYVYEVADSEEVICVDVMKLSPKQLQEIQDELSREIGLLSPMS